jgi:hypothetical protein
MTRQQMVDARRGDGREDGKSQRTADLLRGVEQRGGQTGFVAGTPAFAAVVTARPTKLDAPRDLVPRRDHDRYGTSRALTAEPIPASPPGHQ